MYAFASATSLAGNESVVDVGSGQSEESDQTQVANAGTMCTRTDPTGFGYGVGSQSLNVGSVSPIPPNRYTLTTFNLAGIDLYDNIWR